LDDEELKALSCIKLHNLVRSIKKLRQMLYITVIWMFTKVHIRKIAKISTQCWNESKQKLSSCWDGRLFGHNRYGAKSGGSSAPF